MLMFQDSGKEFKGTEVFYWNVFHGTETSSYLKMCYRYLRGRDEEHLSWGPQVSQQTRQTRAPPPPLPFFLWHLYLQYLVPCVYMYYCLLCLQYLVVSISATSNTIKKRNSSEINPFMYPCLTYPRIPGSDAWAMMWLKENKIFNLF